MHAPICYNLWFLAFCVWMFSVKGWEVAKKFHTGKISCKKGRQQSKLKPRNNISYHKNTPNFLHASVCPEALMGTKVLEQWCKWNHKQTQLYSSLSSMMNQLWQTSPQQLKHLVQNFVAFRWQNCNKHIGKPKIILILPGMSLWGAKKMTSCSRCQWFQNQQGFYSLHTWLHRCICTFMCA